MAVDLTIEGPQDQRRATVAFRLILAVPHLLLVSVLGSLAFVVIVVAWFAALFTARVPDGIVDLLARILRYLARAYGYAWLLTDRYPPFSLGADDPDDYPVSLAIDRPGRFNRAAVLFRGVLQLWALIVWQIAATGLVVVMIVVWLVTLVAGRVPPAAHLATAAVLRYQLRTYAYVGLVTTEYPSGLFGDPPDVAGVDAPSDEEALPPTPRTTRLVLTRGARNLVVLVVVLGTLLQAVNVATSAGRLGSFSTAAELADRHRELERDVDVYLDELDRCTRRGDPACDDDATTGMRSSLVDLRADLAAMDLPANTGDELDLVLADLDEMIAVLDALPPATDQLELRTLRFRFEDAAIAFDRHFADLYDAVLFG